MNMSSLNDKINVMMCFWLWLHLSDWYINYSATKQSSKTFHLNIKTNLFVKWQRHISHKNCSFLCHFFQSITPWTFEFSPFFFIAVIFSNRWLCSLFLCSIFTQMNNIKCIRFSLHSHRALKYLSSLYMCVYSCITQSQGIKIFPHSHSVWIYIYSE